MGREWDRKRKIDELLNDNSLTSEIKKDLEAEREKLKIQLKRKQARNRRNRLSRPQNIVLSVSSPTLSSESTSLSGQQLTFTVSISNKATASTVVNV
jgi:hypothetical protein